MKNIFWKAVARVLNCQKKNYKKAIQIGGEIYIVSIYKFLSSDKEIQKWEDALENSRTPDHKRPSILVNSGNCE